MVNSVIHIQYGKCSGSSYIYSKSLSKIKNQKATTIVSLTLKCETTKYMKCNKGKWD
jgi:hypothetical protein